MNNPKPFMAHTSLFVFLALLLIIIILTGLALFLTEGQSPMQPNQPAGDNRVYPSPTAAQVIAGIKSQQVASQNPISTDLPRPAEATLSPGWAPPGAISDSYRGLITHGDQSQFKIALTFDVCQRDGDLAGFDTEIVRVLSETQTPATFFLGGEWMRDHEANTKELANNPLFELGNHSWSHPDLSTLGTDEIRQQITLTQQEMLSLLGYQTNLFRLPFGTYNEDTLNTINDSGLYVIQWDIVSGDPDPNIDAARMTNWVLQQVKPGSIIIMHANGRGWHTAEALPGIIQSVRQQGYEFVTVSQLLGIASYK